MEDLDFEYDEENAFTDEENAFTDDEALSLKEKNEKLSEEMDRYYALITKDVLDYILMFREKHPEEPLVQIITQYCFEKNLEPELVGDAISQDYYFKQYIENDCKAFPEYCLEQKSSTKIEDW